MKLTKCYVVLVILGVLAPAVNLRADDFAGTWAKKVGKARKEKIVFWSARPECYIRMQASRMLDDMLKDNPAEPVRIVCAKNEYETRQFVITPSPALKDRIKTVRLDVTELRGPENGVISKKNIRIEWLRYTFCKQTSGHKYKKFMPDPLMPVNVGRPDTVGRNGKLNEPANVGFWVTFYVPKDVPAGIYKGKAIARIDGNKKLTRDIEIQVLDITLPHMTHTRTALFTGNFSEWVVRDLAKFRISYGKLPDDPKALVKYGRLMHKLGVPITYVGPWGWPIYDAISAKRYYGHTPKQPKEKALKECRQFWKVHYPILKREGWLDEAYTRMPDEFRKMEVAKRVVKYVKLLHKWAPGLKVLVTASDGLKDDVGDVLKDYVDIWCPIDFQRPFYQERIKAGDQVWPYIHGYAWFASDPIKPLRFYFWRLRVYHANGVCLWCIGPRGKFTAVPYGFIHEDDVVPGDGTLYYPMIDTKSKLTGKIGGAASANRLLHSTRLTAIRDGIEDMEYFWLIDHGIQKAKRNLKSHPEIESQIREVKDFTAKVSKNMWKADPKKVDKAHIAFARLINQLKQISK